MTRNRSKQATPGRRPSTPSASTVHKRMTQGDPEALAIYHDFQDSLIGPDPLAEGAHAWPAWSDLPNTLSPVRPLRGWRMWAVVVTTDGPRLVAPFLTGVYHATPDTPGVSWRPGRNVNSTHGCKVHHGRHPQVECRCGIRAVQSLSVLRAFARNQEPRIGPLVAYAEVDVWGRVAPFAPDDDWQHTIRAEFAEIAGPLHLAPTHAAHADALAAFYGIEVRT
jgi:hypothetical protein